VPPLAAIPPPLVAQLPKMVEFDMVNRPPPLKMLPTPLAELPETVEFVICTVPPLLHIPLPLVVRGGRDNRKLRP
jgi:hypothetical protein